MVGLLTTTADPAPTYEVITAVQDHIRSRIIRDIRHAIRPRTEFTRSQFYELMKETRPTRNAKRTFYSLLTRGMLVYSRTNEAGAAVYKVAPLLVLAQLRMERRTTEEALSVLYKEIAGRLQPLVLAELEAAGKAGMGPKALHALAEGLDPERTGDIWDVCEQLTAQKRVERIQYGSNHGGYKLAR